MPIGIEKQMDRIDALEQMDNEHVAHAVTDILCELARAKRIHPEWPGDVPEQFIIISEEYGEAAKALNDYLHERPSFQTKHFKSFKMELIHTAAMCIRTLENLEAA